jgi:shikimate kinase
MIILVGFMACGKTMLGSLLALCLGRPFKDLDREVERVAGCPVGEIFRREGEAGFRRREEEAFRRLAGAFRGVLAVGGGLPCRPGLARRLREAGLCLYLDTDLDLIIQRLAGPAAASRPLLADLPADERAGRVRALHAERDPHYRRAGRAVPLPADESAEQHLDRLLAAVAGGGKEPA